MKSNERSAPVDLSQWNLEALEKLKEAAFTIASDAAAEALEHVFAAGGTELYFNRVWDHCDPLDLTLTVPLGMSKDDPPSWSTNLRDMVMREMGYAEDHAAFSLIAADLRILADEIDAKVKEQ